MKLTWVAQARFDRILFVGETLDMVSIFTVHAMPFRRLTGSLHSCAKRRLTEGSRNPGRGSTTPRNTYTTVSTLHASVTMVMRVRVTCACWNLWKLFGTRTKVNQLIFLIRLLLCSANTRPCCSASFSNLFWVNCSSKNLYYFCFLFFFFTFVTRWVKRYLLPRFPQPPWEFMTRRHR